MNGRMAASSAWTRLGQLLGGEAQRVAVDAGDLAPGPGGPRLQAQVLAGQAGVLLDLDVGQRRPGRPGGGHDLGVGVVDGRVQAQPGVDRPPGPLPPVAGLVPGHQAHLGQLAKVVAAVGRRLPQRLGALAGRARPERVELVQQRHPQRMGQGGQHRPVGDLQPPLGPGHRAPPDLKELLQVPGNHGPAKPATLLSDQVPGEAGTGQGRPTAAAMASRSGRTRAILTTAPAAWAQSMPRPSAAAAAPAERAATTRPWLAGP